MIERGIRVYRTFLLFLILLHGSEFKRQEEGGRYQETVVGQRNLVIKIEDTALQPLNCTAFLDKLEVSIGIKTQI